MTWTATVRTASDGVLDVSATFADERTSFSWTSTIKEGSEAEFAACANKELEAFQAKHKDDDAKAAEITTLLNG